MSRRVYIEEPDGTKTPYIESLQNPSLDIRTDPDGRVQVISVAGHAEFRGADGRVVKPAQWTETVLGTHPPGSRVVE